jgi:hypothetical protein
MPPRKMPAKKRKAQAQGSPPATKAPPLVGEDHPPRKRAGAKGAKGAKGGSEASRPPIAAFVHRIVDDVPDVKLVTFFLTPNFHVRLRFRPGQWVEIHVPGVAKPGRYSIVSSPALLEEEGYLVVACERSATSEVARWIHDVAKVSDHVRMELGGSAGFFASREDLRRPLLLVAGGVGIAPLCSMLNTWMHERFDDVEREDALNTPLHLMDGGEGYEAPRRVRVVLLFAAKELGAHALARWIWPLVERARGAIRVAFHHSREPASNHPCATPEGLRHAYGPATFEYGKKVIATYDERTGEKLEEKRRKTEGFGAYGDGKKHGENALPARPSLSFLKAFFRALSTSRFDTWRHYPPIPHTRD